MSGFESTFALTTIAKNIREIEVQLGGSQDWLPDNDFQKAFFGRLVTYYQTLQYVPSLKAWARPTADELNLLLEQDGFDIRLRPWLPAPKAFGVVAIEDQLIRWLEPGAITDAEFGRSRRIRINGKPAFRLYRDAHHVEFFESDDSLYPVVSILTLDGDTVFIAQFDPPASGFELLGMIERMVYARPMRFSHYAGVDIPMVNYHHQGVIDWLIGLTTKDGWFITQALLDSRFKMNQHGIRIHEAVATSGCLGGGPEYMQINKAFALWITRPGSEVPIYMRYFTPKFWADPGDLMDAG